MRPADYRKTIEESRNELERLMIQQEDIEQRIARLKQAIIALTPLAEEPNGAPPIDIGFELPGGITDACREIFKASSLGGFTPVEIKEKLLSMKVYLKGHKNIMASIHSTLKRLARNEEIITRDNGLTYEWNRIQPIGRLTPPPRSIAGG